MTLTFFATRALLNRYKMGILVTFSSFFYVGYLVLGAFLFVYIESSNESLASRNVINVKASIMQKFPSVPAEALEELYKQLQAAGVKGIIAENATSKWTLGNSFLFAATLLTTVGYGHLSPSTSVGKVICMFYTIIGIPFTLLLLASYVERLLRASESYKATLFKKLKGLSPMTIRIMHIFSVLIFIVSGSFILPAWFFDYMEASWNYLDALYYCFISLTTVGLGDYVPGLSPQHPFIELYRIATTLYILVGVTIMMFLMAVTADFVHNFNNEYQEILPITVPVEKLPLYPKNIQYGAMDINLLRPQILTSGQPIPTPN